MLNQKLNKELFTKRVSKVACRDGFGKGLLAAAEKDERVVALSADLSSSTRVNLFIEKCPERYIEVGVAEQAMITIASGMANYGKIPFTTSYAVFSPARTWEQIRTTVCLNDVPVKIVGAHAGLGAGPYGATHQGLEDIALMRILPNMVVVAPCDAIETKKATMAIAQNQKPSYIRFAREKTPIITSEDSPFEIGKAEILWDSLENSRIPELQNSKQIKNIKEDKKKSNVKSRKSKSVAIIACGPLVHEALLAAKELEESGIASIVVNSHTIKPLDKVSIVRAARTTGAVVTVEEHQVAGGLGSAVAEVLAKNYPTPMEFIGIPDSFGESGQPDELLKKFGMKAKDIIEAAKKVIGRKIG